MRVQVVLGLVAVNVSFSGMIKRILGRGMNKQLEMKNGFKSICLDFLKIMKAEGIDPLNKIRIIYRFSIGPDLAVPSFKRMVDYFASDEFSFERYGKDYSWILTNSFVGAWLSQIVDLNFNESEFEKLWGDYWAEYQSEFKNVVYFCGVKGLKSQLRFINLDEEVEMYAIPPAATEDIKIDKVQFENFWSHEWHNMFPGGFPGFVLIYRHKQRKMPFGQPSIGPREGTNKIFDVLMSFRLMGTGDVKFGNIFVYEEGQFKFGSGGVTRIGIFQAYGGLEELDFDRTGLDGYRELNSLLLKYYKQSDFKNIEVALRSYQSSCDRFYWNRQDGLLDSVRTLDALLSVRQEWRFRTAYRAAGILGEDPDDRIYLQKLIYDFLGTRNNIIHGNDLDAKDNENIVDEKALRNISRRLLAFFLNLSAANQDKKSFYEQLDNVLIHEGNRKAMRVKGGLKEINA